MSFSFSTMNKFKVELITSPPENNRPLTIKCYFEGKTYFILLRVEKDLGGCPTILVFITPNGVAPDNSGLFCDNVKAEIKGSNYLPLLHRRDGTRVTRSEFRRRLYKREEFRILQTPLSEGQKQINLQESRTKRFSPNIKASLS